jgi:hypothetical protein
MAPERKSDIAQGTSGSGSLNLPIFFQTLTFLSISCTVYSSLIHTNCVYAQYTFYI